MHRITLILLLVIMSTNIAADEWNWVEYGKSETKNDGGFLTLYTDLSKMRIDGTKRKVWQLMDVNKPSTDDALSRIYQEEFDCQAQTQRVTYARIYYGNMGSGKSSVIPLTREEKEFRPVMLNTQNGEIFKMACKP